MHMYEGYHFWGMHLIWWIIWIGLIFWIVATPWVILGQMNRQDDALDILQTRLASGNINHLEYQEHKEILENR